MAALGIRSNSVQKPTRAKSDWSVNNFDASGWALTSPAKETFWNVLEHRGVRFTEVSNPTQCTIHDKGPVDEATLAEVVVELNVLCQAAAVTAANTRHRKVLVTEMRALTKAVNLYQLLNSWRRT